MEITIRPVFNYAASEEAETSPEAAAQPNALAQDSTADTPAAVPPNGTPVTRSPSLPPDSAVPASIALQLKPSAAHDTQSAQNAASSQAAPGGSGTCRRTVGTELYNTSGPNANQPSLNDINQSSKCGDCYFLASLGALVQRNPKAIKNMIQDNGDGTYTVTLYKNNNGIHNLLGLSGNSYKAEQLTVNADEVKQFTSQEATVTDPKDCKRVIWPAVIEAAYAKMKGGESNVCGGGYRKPALETLTGHDAQTYSPSDANELSNLKSQFDSGKLIVVSTTKNLPASNYHLYSSHSYTVTNVYTNNGQTYVTLNNPWGREQPRDIPVSNLKNVSNEIAVGAP